MNEVELARADWPGYFEMLSVQAAGAPISVHALPAASLPRVAPPRGWSLHGCTYDLANEMLELVLCSEGSEQPGLRCFVSEPRSIHAQDSDADRLIVIVDAHQVRTLVRLRRARPARSRPHPRARRRRETGAAGRRFPGSQAPRRGPRHARIAEGLHWS